MKSITKIVSFTNTKFQISDRLQWTIEIMAALESQAVSVERILQFTNVIPEVYVP